MKKLLLLLPLLVACKPKEVITEWRATIEGYTYSYQTSEVQEVTHDCYLAIVSSSFEDETFIEIPVNYSKTYVDLVKTNKMIYYWVYDRDYIVSNRGWERV